jgi:mRNA-degrading endonuclease toxin of MazEF toxin-antitoxin module
LPDGSLKPHPVLVVSNQSVLDCEDIFYAVMISTKEYNDDFSFEIKDEMLTKPLSKKSFVKCQLIQSYSESEVLSKISSVKISTFSKIKEMIFETVF